MKLTNDLEIVEENIGEIDVYTGGMHEVTVDVAIINGNCVGGHARAPWCQFEVVETEVRKVLVAEQIDPTDGMGPPRGSKSLNGEDRNS